MTALWVRLRAGIKKILLSNCAAVVGGVVLFVLHLHWFLVTRPDRGVDAISGLGAALVALGIWLAVRPFFRKGIRRAIEEATGKDMSPLIGFLAAPGYMKSARAQRPQVREGCHR